MDKEQEVLLNFVNLHASKTYTCDERCIHIAKYNPDGIPIDAEFEILNINDVLHKYNTNETLIQWVLRQMHTYDTEKQIILGIEFDKNKILSHVLQLKPSDDF